MLQPENQTKKYERLFLDIDSGKIKIPNFQRRFVWGKVQTAKLIDSIIKGFPIGTFIFWETKEELRHHRNIGNVKLPKTPKGDAVSYVLDGQQRITSLYAARKGLIYTHEEKNGDKQEIDYRDIAIDLGLDPNANEEVVMTELPENGPYISIHELLKGDFIDWMEQYSKDELKKITVYKKRLTEYDFSTILMPGYPLDIACEVFTRINTGGTELTLFEIMVAKTYDEKEKFDLAERYEWLIDNKGAEKDLEDVDFDTIPPITVLQCVAAYLIKQVRRKDILKLDKRKFIENWDVVKDGLFDAVDFVRKYFHVRVSLLLPYNAIMVPFCYFFIKMQGKKPSNKQIKLLKQYFFWASLSERFASGAEGKIALDLKRMDEIFEEKPPEYRGEEVELDITNLREQWFSAGNAFCKGILCLYASFKPKSFDGDVDVELGNAWLKRANSRNYHHFFPKSYLRKQGYQNWYANSILNITFVDDYLNKRTIGSKAPGRYMKTFRRSNKNLAKTMKTHLIDDLDAFGVFDNDYNRFIERRGKRVLREINKRLNPRV